LPSSTHMPARHINATYHEHDLRLVGRHPLEGKLQIYHDGTWGTICDDNWDMRDAQVACRQLGLGDVADAMISYYSDDYFDIFSYTFDWESDGGLQEHLPTFMDEVRCSGSEVRLAHCAFSGWNVEDCGHFEDVAIRCKGVNVARMALLTVSFGCATVIVSLASFTIAVLAFMRVLKVQQKLAPRIPADAPATIALKPPADEASATELETSSEVPSTMSRLRFQSDEAYSPLL